MLEYVSLSCTFCILSLYYAMADQCSAGLEDMDDANFPSCSDGFYLVVVNGTAGSCQPECATWEELPHHVIAVGDAFAISQAVVYIISAGVLLVIACIEHKRMYVSPMIIYNNKHNYCMYTLIAPLCSIAYMAISSDIEQLNEQAI